MQYILNCKCNCCLDLSWIRVKFHPVDDMFTIVIENGHVGVGKIQRFLTILNYTSVAQLQQSFVPLVITFLTDSCHT